RPVSVETGNVEPVPSRKHEWTGVRKVIRCGTLSARHLRFCPRLGDSKDLQLRIFLRRIRRIEPKLSALDHVRRGSCVDPELNRIEIGIAFAAETQGRRVSVRRGDRTPVNIVSLRSWRKNIDDDWGSDRRDR